MAIYSKALILLLLFHVFFYFAVASMLLSKSDSGVMFVYKAIRDILSIDHMCINRICRIRLIHKWSSDLC